MGKIEIEYFRRGGKNLKTLKAVNTTPEDGKKYVLKNLQTGQEDCMFTVFAKDPTEFSVVETGN